MGFRRWQYQHKRKANHIYKSTGSYTVTLTVTDGRGNADTQELEYYTNVTSGWNAGGIASSAWNDLAIFGHDLVSVFIWLGIFNPVWIVIDGIIYWHRRRMKASS